MTVVEGRYGRLVPEPLSSPEFPMLPLFPLPVGPQKLHNIPPGVLIRDDRFAVISEGQGNAPPARQEASDLHQRKQSRRFAVTYLREIARPVAVGIVKHPRPDGRMD